MKVQRTIAGLSWPRRQGVPASTDLSLENSVGLIARSDAGIFWSTDQDCRIVSMCASGLKLLARTSENTIGKRFSTVFADISGNEAIPEQRSLSLKFSAKSKINNHIVMAEPQDEQGPAVWLQISGRPHFDGDSFLGYYGIATDVTSLISDRQNRLLQEKYDEQTGFYNATYFGKRFQSTFAGLAHSERACALMTIDVDQFRMANERFGVASLDAATAEMAGRLRSVLGTRGEVGRVAEDQFRVILADVDDRGILAELAERATKLLSQPYRINNRRIHLQVSIGVAIAPYDATSANQLVDATNLALRSVRQAGGGYGFFTLELADEALRYECMQRELEGALARREFGLRYTPLIDAKSNELVALKAELHWHNPEVGEVQPTVFWPLVEGSEAALTIGEWMLREACRDAVTWPSSLRVALSLPSRFLKDPGFRRVLADATSSNAMVPARLELELPEELLVEDPDKSKNLVANISSLGVRTVVSGFGDGSSSITLLADLKFDRVDISPKFIRNWALQPERANAVLSAIVSVSRSFDVRTSVTYIDALDVLAAARTCGVDLVHGPVFSSPLSADQIARGEGVFARFSAKGPARQRAERMVLLRKIGLVHDDYYYDVLLKNMSKTGAKVAGIAGVPVGTDVVLDLGNGQLAVAKVVNSDEKSQGLQFEVPLVDDGNGGLMTRHRISPYTLAEAGLPVAALDSDQDALKAWKDRKRGSPSFVQLQLTHL